MQTAMSGSPSGCSGFARVGGGASRSTIATVPSGATSRPPPATRADKPSSILPGRSRAGRVTVPQKPLRSRRPSTVRGMRHSRRRRWQVPSTSSSSASRPAAGVEAGAQERTTRRRCPTGRRAGQLCSRGPPEDSRRENLVHRDRRSARRAVAPLASAAFMTVHTSVRAASGPGRRPAGARGGARPRSGGAPPRLPRPAQAQPLRPRGHETISVGAHDDGRGHGRASCAATSCRLRVGGMDWPLQGLTMAGLAAARRPPGVRRVDRRGRRRGRPDRGRRVAGRRVDRHARHARRPRRDGRTRLRRRLVPGLPRGPATTPRGERATSAPSTSSRRPLEEVRGELRAARLDEACDVRARLLRGHAARRSPAAAGRSSASTATPMTPRALALRLRSTPASRVGGYLIVDDYGALDECRRAVDEFRAEHGITEPLEQVDWTCVRWRRDERCADRERRRRGAPGRGTRRAAAARRRAPRGPARADGARARARAPAGRARERASSRRPPSCSACGRAAGAGARDGWAGDSGGERPR